MRKGITAAALTAALMGSMVSPAAAEDGISPIDTDYLLNFPLNTGRVIAQPLRWDTNDWLIAGGAAAGFASLLLLDTSINDFVQDSRSETSDSIADIFNNFGESYLMAGASVALWAAGEATDNPRLQRVGLNGVQAIVIAQLLTQGTKYAFGRSRPASSDDSWDFFEYTEDDDSFGSGHAATAFAFATVVSQEYKHDYPWVPYVAYGMAAGTAYARLNNERHWASDVALGALWGIGAGWIVSKYTPFGGPDLNVMPTASADHLGVVAHMTF